MAQQQIDIPGQPAGAPPARAKPSESGGDDAPVERRRRRATAEAGSPETVTAEAKNESKAETPAAAQGEARGDAGDDGRQGRRDRRDRDRGGRQDRQDRDRGDRRKDNEQQGGGQQQGGGRQDRQDRQQQGQQQSGGRQDRQDRQQRDNGPQDDDDFEGGRRGRRGRYRDRRGRRGRDEFGGAAGEPQVADDDVLIPVAGILDILDNYAFIRTSGYLPGPNDVYVSLAQVRKNGLRKGDHVTGAVRQPKEGERREKFNALVRLDSVNGMAPEHGRGRPEFNKLTPLYPQDRLRLETDPGC